MAPAVLLDLCLHSFKRNWNWWAITWLWLIGALRVRKQLTPGKTIRKTMQCRAHCTPAPHWGSTFSVFQGNFLNGPCTRQLFARISSSSAEEQHRHNNGSSHIRHISNINTIGGCQRISRPHIAPTLPEIPDIAVGLFVFWAVPPLWTRPLHSPCVLDSVWDWDWDCSAASISFSIKWRCSTRFSINLDV